MFQRSFLCCFFIFCFFCAGAEIFPVNNSTVNFTSVYVQDDQVKLTGNYELLVFTDSVYMQDQRPEITISNNLPAFWLTGLQWGKTYLWRIRSLDQNKKEVSITSIRVFKIQPLAYENFEQVALDVKKNDTTKNAGGLICVDYSRSIFKRNGEVVWTIPDSDTMMNHKVQVRDLKVTKNNTVTFLTGRAPIEIDLEGNILWSGPYPLVINSDTVMYHHDFQRTSRGTYMVLGLKRVYRKVLGKYDPETIQKETELKMVDGVLYKRTQLTMLLEFDKEGKLIWSWDASDYITNEDLNFKKTPAGMPNFGSHANAFGENAAGTKVYVGFRDLSRIIKIDKRTKKVELTYGEEYPSGHGQFARKLFRKQHGATITNHNSIIILNNNSNLKDGGVSSVLELKDNVSSDDSVLIWKFDLDFDTLTKGRSVSGGIVYELHNSNLLVCAGTLNRIFEVTRNKEVVWDAFVMSKRLSEPSWQAAPQYRASWVGELKRYHVLAQVVSSSKTGNDVALTVKLNNTGTAADAYVVQVFSPEGQLLQKQNTSDIKPNGSQTLDLKFKHRSDKSEMKVVVYSTNSRATNSINLTINETGIKQK